MSPHSDLGTPTRLLVGGYIFAVVLLSYEQGLVTGITSGGLLWFAARASGLLVGAAFMIHCFAKRKTLVLPQEYKWLFAWLLFSIVTAPLAARVDLATLRVATLLQILPLALIVTNFILWNRDARPYWLAFIWAAASSAALVAINPSAYSDADGRVYGTLGNSNDYGLMLSVAFSISLASLLGAQRLPNKLFFLISAILFVYTSLLTGSRQVIVVDLVAAFAICAVFAERFRRRKPGQFIAAVTLAVVVIFVIVALVGSSRYLDRFTNAVGFAQTDNIAAADTSIQGRLWLYKHAFSLALENPVFGIGLWNFDTTAGAGFGRQVGAYSHSNYTEILVSGGIPAFILYFAIYACWWSTLLKLRFLARDSTLSSRYSLALALALTFLISDVTHVSYYGKFQWLIAAGLIAELRLLRAQAHANPASRELSSRKQLSEAIIGRYVR